MKKLLYPKIYATVVRVLAPNPDAKPDRIVAVDDDGDRYDLALKHRRGKGSCGGNPIGAFDFGKGTRIKVYNRNGIFRFSRVGA